MDRSSTLSTSHIRQAPTPSMPPSLHKFAARDSSGMHTNMSENGDGVLIGMLSAMGSSMLIAILFGCVYFLRNTNRGRILLDRVGRPGQYDDEQAMLREEAEALETMDEIQRGEYMRAKAFIETYPPETAQTDISLSQFLAIQEKGVSAWEFEPELEIANCFVEGRTEIEFFDSVCTVQSNLPIPKQNEVYYWEAKMYDKPDSTMLSIGLTTKPYPLFRLPGWHKQSVAYTSTGQRRYNQPFSATNYGPEILQGDVVGVGYRPRTGTIFFTRNGKKFEDVAHGLKTQNFFPSIGANGPCNIHVNFGQSGFVFIEANVKKWGLAPMTGSLAPPPPYGSEQGSILLEAGGESAQQDQAYSAPRHGRSRSRFGPVIAGLTSPGPVRSPTEISLAQLAHMPSHEDIGEGSSRDVAGSLLPQGHSFQTIQDSNRPGIPERHASLHPDDIAVPPPEYMSPEGSSDENESTTSEAPLMVQALPNPPIPSYDVAIGQAPDTTADGRDSSRDHRGRD